MALIPDHTMADSFYLLEDKSDTEDFGHDNPEPARTAIASRASLTKNQSVLFSELCRILEACKKPGNGNANRFSAISRSTNRKAEDEQSLLDETLNEVTFKLFHSLWKDRNIEDAFALTSLHWTSGLSPVKPVRRDVLRIRQTLLKLKAQGITRFVSVGCQTGCYEWFISNCVDSHAGGEVSKHDGELVIEGIAPDVDSQNSSHCYIQKYPPHSQHAAHLFDYRHSHEKICLIFVNIDPDDYDDYLKIPNVHRICAIEKCDHTSDDYLSFVNSPVYGWDNVKDIAGEECYVAVFERMDDTDETNWACSFNSLFCFCVTP